MAPLKNIIEDLIEALLEGNSTKIQAMLCEDCKVHLPFHSHDRPTYLEGKKEVLDYFNAHFTVPIAEEITNKKYVVRDKSHIVVSFEGHCRTHGHNEVFEYCMYCEVSGNKIKELYALI